MKNNKAFTLIELLGVIVILVLILLVAVHNIASSFEKNKSKIKKQKEEIVFNASEIYANKYKKTFDYESFLGGTCGISISNLKEKELLTEDELLDSEGNVIFTDDVIIKYNKNDGKYEIGEGISICPAASICIGTDETSALNTLNKLGFTPNFELLTVFSNGMTRTTNLIAGAYDDLGKSYYFRGNVTNNYVKFGKNTSGKDMWWRIVRINGDGSIRLIYDGTQAYGNGYANKDSAVSYSGYNDSYYSNGHVGYMYGSTLGETYELEHSNDIDSTIKTKVDYWYKTTISGTKYEGYVVDAIYCNDRTLEEMWSPLPDWAGTGPGSWGNNTGIGKDQTYYATYQRNVFGDDSKVECLDGEDCSNYVTPTLECSRVEDRFTVKSSSIVTKNCQGTNRELTYPVGLITVDELVFSGYHPYVDDHYYSPGYNYLYSKVKSWTMSPNRLDGYAESSIGMVWTPSVFDDEGIDASAGGYINGTGYTYGVRPVISIKADSIIGGTGIATDPFRVE